MLVDHKFIALNVSPGALAIAYFALLKLALLKLALHVQIHP
jgi:hypothetical protein